MSEMTSSKPYLVRAIYEWIMDNGFTPYVAINANYPGVSVPQKYIENGGIVLNVSPVATNRLLINNEHLEFDARFGGLVSHIYAPIQSVKAIYARENNRGMAFDDEGMDDGDSTPPPSGSTTTEGGSGGDAGKKSHLRVIK
jgi:stringent starvation protein B